VLSISQTQLYLLSYMTEAASNYMFRPLELGHIARSTKYNTPAHHIPMDSRKSATPAAPRTLAHH